jgi:hypothetical protein
VDRGLMGEALFRLEHRHSDGSWERLEPRVHHDPAEHDPETGWADGDVYVCPSCDERVRVRYPVEGGPHSDEG